MYNIADFLNNIGNYSFMTDKLMRQVQDLREEALTGRLKVAELRERYDGISLRRKRKAR